MSVSPLRVVVVDDEPVARNRLRILLKSEKDFLLVGEAVDGPQAVSLIRKLRPDVLLLDVLLPTFDGFGVLARLRERTPPSVIFVTASGDHAVRAFESQAVDYVLKPIAPARLRESLRRARLRWQRRTTFGIGGSARDRHPSGLIALRTQTRESVVAIKDIRFALSANSRSRVFVTDKDMVVEESLGSLARRLPSDRFVRISRSSLVSLDHVVGYKPKSHGDQHLLMRGGARLVVSRSRRRTVLARIKRECEDLKTS